MPEAACLKHFKQRVADAGYTQTDNLLRIKWDQEIDYPLIEEMITLNMKEKKIIQSSGEIINNCYIHGSKYLYLNVNHTIRAPKMIVLKLSFKELILLMLFLALNLHFHRNILISE